MVENKLLFYIKPEVKQYLTRLELVKVKLKYILDIALIDFMMVSSVFKKYNQFVDPSMSNEDALMVALSVKELQYMDTFSQKLNHIIQLNQIVVEGQDSSVNLTTDHAGFIFKLNFLQATVAAHEFLTNAADLRKNLDSLHDHIISVTGLDFHESQYFQHLREVEEKISLTKSILSEVYLERYRESPISVSGIENEVRKISDLYTMASERFVLRWLLKHNYAPEEELLEDYKEEAYGTEEEIDLF